MQQFKYGITVSDASSPGDPIIFTGNYEESISKVAGIGFDAIEIHVRNPLDLPYDKILASCQQEKITVSAMATGWSYVSEGLSFIDEDPRMRDQAILRFKEYIDLASHLDCLVILGLMRGIIDDFSRYDKYMELLKSALSIVIDYAESKGVTVVIEAINRFQTNYINNLYETIELFKDFEGSSIGLHFDTFHMNIEDRDIIKTINDCGNWIKYVHFSDSNRLIPGAGNIDFLSIMKSLKEIEYNGFITIESLPSPSAIEAAENGLEYMRTVESLINQKYAMGTLY